MFAPLLESSIGGSLAEWLKREDLGRIRLTSKRMRDAVDANDELLRPFLPPCECGRGCGGLCVCPFGTLPERALHYARLTQSAVDCRGAWVGRDHYWRTTTVPSSPFGQGLKPTGVCWVEDRLRLPCVPKGRYLFMTRFRGSYKEVQNTSLHFYAWVQSHDANYHGDKNLSSWRIQFSFASCIAAGAARADRFGWARLIWPTPIDVDESGQSVVLGIKCIDSSLVPHWTFDWLRLVPHPESVSLSDMMHHPDLFFACGPLEDASSAETEEDDFGSGSEYDDLRYDSWSENSRN